MLRPLPPSGGAVCVVQLESVGVSVQQSKNFVVIAHNDLSPASEAKQESTITTIASTLAFCMILPVRCYPAYPASNALVCACMHTYTHVRTHKLYMYMLAELSN